MNDGKHRCSWPSEDPIYVAYHDEEWGVPEHDDRALFEKLILDGFQAGLAWITILRKRDNFRKAFDGFEPGVIVKYKPAKIEKLMQDKGIVRNRSKIVSTVKAAQAWIDIREGGQSFDDFLWQFVGGAPINNKWKTWQDTPTESEESRAMSKALKAAGFNYCGPTICYAFMQAVGMINDHEVRCFRHSEV